MGFGEFDKGKGGRGSPDWGGLRFEKGGPGGRGGESFGAGFGKSGEGTRGTRWGWKMGDVGEAGGGFSGGGFLPVGLEAQEMSASSSS